MSTPPAPRLSADGKFWWDGERWQPMAASPVAAAPKRRGCVGLVVAGLVVAVVIIAIASSQHPSASLKLDAHSRGLHPSVVGEEGGETLAITNQDSDISDLAIFYNDGSDNWLDHHVVTGDGGCQIDKGRKAFLCGPLKAGASRTITITATAKDSGNFEYGWGLGDHTQNGLRQWSEKFTWSEAITQK